MASSELPTIPAELLGSPHPNAERVSLVQILANPAAFQGKAVRVFGFGHIAFEGNSLCLHRDDVEYLILTNCVWLDISSREEIRALSDRYVAVEGVIDAQGHGHLGRYQATITKIGGLAALPSRTQLESEPASHEP